MDGDLVLVKPDYPALVPRRRPDAHKYSAGRVLVVAGSARYPGAAVLATRGAQRAGSGYVTLAIPVQAAQVAAMHLVSAPVQPYLVTATGVAPSDLDVLLKTAASADAVVVGPGLTTTPSAIDVVLALVNECSTPLVLDADALNILSLHSECLEARTSPCVLTPHAGEARRLARAQGIDEDLERVRLCSALSTGERVTVLKGPGSVVSDGPRVVVNGTGGAELATAGTGDVLAGVIGALIAQGLSAFDAAALGVYVHGIAGEHCRRRLGTLGVIAEDVAGELPRALKEALR